METKKTSGIFSLNWLDVGKGAIVAAVSAGLTAVYGVLTNTGPIDWEAVGKVALTAGIGYLIKNAFTPSQEVVIKK